MIRIKVKYKTLKKKIFRTDLKDLNPAVNLAETPTVWNGNIFGLQRIHTVWNGDVVYPTFLLILYQGTKTIGEALLRSGAHLPDVVKKQPFQNMGKTVKILFSHFPSPL